MDFDIGVLSFSYDPTGEYLQNIMILDRDQANNRQTHAVSRDYLVDALNTGMKVRLIRENIAVNRSSVPEESRYSVRRSILPLKVNSRIYIKATNDKSACDDLG